MVGMDPAARGRGTLGLGGFEAGIKGDDMKQCKYLVWSLAMVSIVAGGAYAGQDVMTGKCVKVVDGDTLIIECDKDRRTVDIEGIDAPELDQPWGKEVRSFVKDMVRSQELEIEIVESGADGVVARVFVDGTDLSEMLVSRGLAWVPEDSTDADLVGMGSKAKDLPCGLWIDADAEPPWEFRAARS